MMLIFTWLLLVTLSGLYITWVILMKTIISYKVVYVDRYGDIQEYDTESLAEARQLATTVQNALIYKIEIIGSIERVL